MAVWFLMCWSVVAAPSEWGQYSEWRHCKASEHVVTYHFRQPQLRCRCVERMT